MRKRRDPRNCPTCGAEHRKKTTYCSISCSSSRQRSPEARERIAAANQRTWDTASEERREAAADLRRFQNKHSPDIQTFDDWWVDIPDDGAANPDNDIWTEV